MGVAIGGLAVGSAIPHLINGTGGVGSNWRLLLATTSCMAAIGGVIVVGCVRTGPYAFSKAKFSVYAIGRALSNRPVALAIFGYCGHMWELYVSVMLHKLQYVCTYSTSMKYGNSIFCVLAHRCIALSLNCIAMRLLVVLSSCI
jgi:hypothetical protein